MDAVWDWISRQDDHCGVDNDGREWSSQVSDRAGLVEALHQDEEVAARLSDDLTALGRKFDDFVESIREWRDEQEERYAELGHDPDPGWTPCPEGADELDQLLEVETFLRGDESTDLLVEDEREFVEEVRSGILFPHKHLLDIIDRLAPRPEVDCG